MNLIPVRDLEDPRLADYAGVRERQLADDFQARGGPGTPAAGSAEAPHGKFMAEGELVFRRLVASPFRTLSVLCTPARLGTIGSDLERLEAGTPVYVIEPAVLTRLIGFNLHRGLMAIGARRAPRSIGEVVAGPGVYAVLEDLANHDNIGSVFRNAAALGVRGVLLSPGCADPLYRKSVRVSMGYALMIPFTVVPAWPRGLADLQAAGAHVVACAPGGGAMELRSLSGKAWDPSKSRILCLFGAEGPGLTLGALGMAEARVEIPMEGGVDSLNVAVASALVFEHLRWVGKRTDVQGIHGGEP